MHLARIDFKALRKLRLNGVTKLTKPVFDNPLKLKKINIFIGPNGGGKSTIIDLIRSINNPSLLPTLPRENMRQDTLSGFTLTFEDMTVLTGVINKTDINEYGMSLLLYIEGLKFEYQGFFNRKFNDSGSSKIKNIYKSIPAKVSYRNRHNEEGITLSEFVTSMNNERLSLEGLFPTHLDEEQFYYSGPPGLDRSSAENNPVQIESEKTSLLSLWLNDDHLQSNLVTLGMLPSGWRAFCGLLAWLNKQPDGSLCVIEEPETHIHPRLLRKMIGRIISVRESKELQIFITTHSSILMDLELWGGGEDVALFDVDSSDVSVLTDPFKLLSNMGIKPSDINHSNGIIWVEGPSDRLYILHWLNLYCKEHGNQVFRENIHFSVLTYGGSILSHLTTNSEDDKINIFKVNRNSLVVIDKDLDFKNENGKLIAVNENKTKNKIRETVCSIITDGYTIESYLPNDFFHNYFEMTGKKVTKKSSLSKVDIAKKYCNNYNSINNCFAHANGVYFIKFIHDEIIKWNQ
ncbi:ATP-dependent nuclease [Morganella morganii]|uniref:ATP-dependent nuclease n=1 Tax=Morganella morganii TaxID=582 RepID=UPI002795BE75|nr:AAA family ATPase [Morganella morganii]WLV39287.1 AAA family ATPase [Morganella morganii]